MHHGDLVRRPDGSNLTVRSLAILLALASPAAAAAADPDTLTREDRALYLKCAYVLNDGSKELRSIDLSTWSKEELELCIEPRPFAEAVPTPEPKPVLMKADRPVSDICSRQGLRKVYTDSGTSWRCRK
jgi:hypothetical protein